jgi:hypothetical protein
MIKIRRQKKNRNKIILFLSLSNLNFAKRLSNKCDIE